MNKVDDCIFCKIVAREIPADIVYEDEYILAFLDIAPVNPGHTLIIPKIHVQDFLSASEETVDRVYRAAQKIGHSLINNLGAEGVNTTTNNGAAAGQEVFHWHVHAIPRYAGDGHGPWKQGSYEGEEAKIVAEKIRTAI